MTSKLPSSVIQKKYDIEWENRNKELYKEVVKEVKEGSVFLKEDMNFENYATEVLSSLDLISESTKYPLMIYNLTKCLIRVSIDYLLRDYYFDKNYDFIVDKLFDVYCRKNKDYNNSAEKQMMIDGILSFKTRLQDKISRIDSFNRSKELKVKDEKIVDTIMDLTNYCVIFCIWYKKGEI